MVKFRIRVYANLVKVVNKLFGVMHGYGLIPITLDWTILTGFIGSPLIPPFHATANILSGVMLFFVIVSCGIHFSGIWYADYFPVQSSLSFDNTGNRYNISRILNDRLQFDEAQYFAYSPLFLSTQFALAYGLAFAAVSSVFIHVILYHGKDIVKRFKQARDQEDVCVLFPFSEIIIHIPIKNLSYLVRATFECSCNHGCLSTDANHND